MVERSAVNRMVTGSNPVSPAKIKCAVSAFFLILPTVCGVLAMEQLK